MGWRLSPRQRQAEEYFASLSEAERQQQAKRFYQYLRKVYSVLPKEISHGELLTVFEVYCNSVLRNRPGQFCMRFRKYRFVLRKIGALDQSHTGHYVIKPWPEELSLAERLQLYLAHQSQAASESGGVSAAARDLTQTIKGLLSLHRQSLMMDKCEVTITSTGDLHDAKIQFQSVVVDSAVALKPQTIEIEISNTSQYHSKKLLRCGFIQPCPSFVLEDKEAISNGLATSVKLVPRASYSVKCTFAPKHMSVYKTTLAFEFKDGETGNKFHIIRFVFGSGQASQTDMELVKPKAPYTPFRSKPRPRGLPIIDVDGIDRKPPRPRHPMQRGRALAEYRIPPEITNEMKKNNSGPKLEQLRENFQQNYKEIFTTLLWIEEKQMHQDIRRYDRKKTMDKTPGGYLTLEVDGLAENRPSLLKGDHLFVSYEDEGHEYKGYVHRVLKETVWLKFHSSFHKNFLPGRKYNIRFTFNRLPQRLQHRALQLAEPLSPRLLFPTSLNISTPSLCSQKLSFLDQQVERNEKQRQAVTRIVSGCSRPAPYVIFGPPGTGKTKTTVEAIKQALNTRVICI
jgi:helicase MOV-10